MLAFSSFAVNVFAANEDADLDMGEDVVIETLPNIYVSASGNDTTNDGSGNKPFASLEKAFTRVANHGTIYIVNEVIVPATSNWIKIHIRFI